MMGLEGNGREILLCVRVCVIKKERERERKRERERAREKREKREHARVCV